MKFTDFVLLTHMQHRYRVAICEHRTDILCAQYAQIYSLL